jgi:hypothetical protein
MIWKGSFLRPIQQPIMRQKSGRRRRPNSNRRKILECDENSFLGYDFFVLLNLLFPAQCKYQSSNHLLAPKPSKPFVSNHPYKDSKWLRPNFMTNSQPILSGSNRKLSTLSTSSSRSPSSSYSSSSSHQNHNIIREWFQHVFKGSLFDILDVVRAHFNELSHYL